MSNPSVCFLSSAIIDGMNFRIEDNLGEAIHIHMGKLRIALSIKDYLVFAESVMRAVRDLFNIRGIKLETLDEESLKGEWLLHYDKIKLAQIEYIELEALYMKESYVKNRAITRIIPLRESGYIKVLNEESNDIEYYEEPGKLQASRIEKLKFIYKKIEEEGYPWDSKLIFVNQEGYIYDGIKRASCLYALYGGNKKVPVLHIYLPEVKTIDEQRKEAEDKVQAWETTSVDIRNRREYETLREEKSSLKELIKSIKKTNLPFFMIEKEIRDKEGFLLAVARIIVEEEKLNIIEESLNIAQKRMSPYDDYQYLYTASKPLYYLTSDGPVLIFDRLCCKNKFEKYILPLDRYIIKNSWKNIAWNEKWQCYCAAANIHILMILMDSMLECGYFDQTDIEFIQCHREVLYQQDFKILLEKEFYRYSQFLIGYLLSNQYDHAISMYEKFDDY